MLKTLERRRRTAANQAGKLARNIPHLQSDDHPDTTKGEDEEKCGGYLEIFELLQHPIQMDDLLAGGRRAFMAGS